VEAFIALNISWCDVEKY